MLKIAFIAAVAVAIVLFVYSLSTRQAIAPIESVRSFLAGTDSSKAAAPPPAAEPAAPEPAKPAPARGRSTARAGGAPAKTTAAAADRPGPRVPRPTPLLPPVRVAPPPPRKPLPVPPSHYLPGNTTAWTTFDIRVQGPTMVLARGTIATPSDSASPNGLHESHRERAAGFAPE